MTSVLLVEPDRQLALIYRAALENNGHRVEHRLTAESAIAALDATNIDLVILEVQIALHNGIEFLYEMRSYSEWQDIPIVLHTNIPEKQLLRSDNLNKQLHVKTYLYKPATSLQKLLDTVQSSVAQLQP